MKNIKFTLVKRERLENLLAYEVKAIPPLAKSALITTSHFLIISLNVIGFLHI
jgi:hypothetical protein